MKRSWISVLLVVLLGAAMGGGGRLLTWGKGGSTDAAGARPSGSKSARLERMVAAYELPPRPDATIEALLADQSPDGAARLAYWLLDASGSELVRVYGEMWETRGRPQYVMETLLARWMEIDPEGALAATRETTWNSRALGLWVAIDVEAALAAARKDPEKLMPSALQALARIDPRRVLKILDEEPDLLSNQIMRAVAGSLGRDHPEEAMGLLDGSTSGTSSILQNWARDAPEEALKWYVENTKISELPRDFGPLAETLATEYPERLAELAASLPSGEMREALLVAGARERLWTDPEAAIEMARAVNAPRTQRAMYGAIGSEIAYEDPERALELLEEALENGGLRYQTRVRYPRGSSSTTGRWAPGTAEWLDGLAGTLPEETMAVIGIGERRGHRSELRTAFALDWARRSPDAFGEWLERQAPGGARDNLVREVGMEISTRRDADFERAVRWESLTESQARMPILMRKWKERAPEELADFIASGEAPSIAVDAYQALQGGGSE